MNHEKALSDLARAAGVRIRLATDVHLSFNDRTGVRRSFYRSAFRHRA